MHMPLAWSLLGIFRTALGMLVVRQYYCLHFHRPARLLVAAIPGKRLRTWWACKQPMLTAIATDPVVSQGNGMAAKANSA